MGLGDEDERLHALARTGLKPAPDAELDLFARIVRTHLRVPVALVSLVEADRQIFPGMDGLTGWAAETRETPLSHSFCQHVTRSGEPLVVTDARTDPVVRDNLAVRDLGVVAYAGMPLTDAGGRVLGALCAIDTEPRTWTAAELDALRDLAAACSSELRARDVLHQTQVAQAAALDAQTRAEAARTRLTLLGDVTRSLVRSLDSRQTLDYLTRVLVPKTADWSMVFLSSAGRLTGPAVGWHGDPARLADVQALATLHPRLASDVALVRQVARTGTTVFMAEVESGVNQAGSRSPEVPELVDRLGLASIILVPLRGRTDVVGVLLLSRGSTSPPFDSDDVGLAREIGRRAGIALENATLYGQQSRTAEVLQRSMLTRLPEPDHLQIVARYIPAAHEVHVGGDWYDAFLQPDGATVLVIGDVVGHDMTAAAEMGQLRNLLRGTAYDRGETPAAVLGRVDAAIEGLAVHTTATAIVARIEQTPEDAARQVRKLRWATAGHPPPMVVKPDGSVVVLDHAPDLMLGVDYSFPRVDHAIDLEKGSTLLLYTDGLVERRDHDLGLGIERLAVALADSEAESLDSVCDRILEELRPHDGEDDVALLAVRLHAEDAPRPVEAGPQVVPAVRPLVG